MLCSRRSTAELVDSFPVVLAMRTCPACKPAGASLSLVLPVRMDGERCTLSSQRSECDGTVCRPCFAERHRTTHQPACPPPSPCSQLGPPARGQRSWLDGVPSQPAAAAGPLPPRQRLSRCSRRRAARDSSGSQGSPAKRPAARCAHPPCLSWFAGLTWCPCACERERWVGPGRHCTAQHPAARSRPSAGSNRQASPQGTAASSGSAAKGAAVASSAGAAMCIFVEEAPAAVE